MFSKYTSDLEKIYIFSLHFLYLFRKRNQLQRIDIIYVSYIYGSPIPNDKDNIFLKNTIILRRKIETETSQHERGKTKSMQLLRVLNSEGILLKDNYQDHWLGGSPQPR